MCRDRRYNMERFAVTCTVCKSSVCLSRHPAVLCRGTIQGHRDLTCTPHPTPPPLFVSLRTPALQHYTHGFRSTFHPHRRVALCPLLAQGSGQPARACTQGGSRQGFTWGFWLRCQRSTLWRLVAPSRPGG